MRFSNWYSISLFLIFATFVATIGVFFIRSNNICLFCLVSKRARDCEQFKKVMGATAQQPEINASEQLKVEHLSALQAYQATLNAMADGAEKNAQIWQSLTMQEPKSKQLQNSLIESYKLLAEGLRDDAKNLKVESVKIQGKIQKQVFYTTHAGVKGQTKLNEAGNELEKYCPNVYGDKVYDALGMLKPLEKLSQKS